MKNTDYVIKNMDFSGDLISCEKYGDGHINDTFLVVTTEKRYILQKMNSDIFKNPEMLMKNISEVTEFLRKKIILNGGNPDRETLNLIKTKDKKNYFIDEEKNHWRGYLFVEDTLSFSKVEKPSDFYESALAFGKFQGLLSDYPANTLEETIPDFHNTKKRVLNFKKALNEDKLGRAKLVKEEINFFLEREDEAQICLDMLESGELPLRVTHNDTKLNNILLDKNTRKAICVIDLDTVMPGLSINDYGDAIRFGANTSLEDEPDYKKAGLDLNLFEIFTKGFIEGCEGNLTDKEISMLPWGAKLMTYECGIRFLTDYLEGDTYFKISRENHNLDRTRTQIQLVKSMEDKWEQMAHIVKKF